MNHFQIFVREWRNHRNYSQEALANRAGLNQETISAIENGNINITLNTLEKIASALSTTPPSLYDRPKEFSQPLDRFHIDRVARSVVYGRPLQTRLVRDIASLVSQKLKIHKAPGRRIVSNVRWSAKKRSVEIRRQYGEPFVRTVLARIDRFL